MMQHVTSCPIRIPDSKSPPQNLVKPPNRENPRQSRRFAWRISYIQTARIELGNQKRPRKIPGPLHLTHNSFDWTILAVTLLI
jgi:hypothetical protein